MMVLVIRVVMVALLVALMNTHDAGTLPNAEWERAADAADAAQRDIGG
jgi:hypothetical protein